MARRGTLTALQAALAGIGGAAGGYVQQEELKRKRLIEEQDREAQGIARQLAMVQSRVRPRQAAAPLAPGAAAAPPSGYVPIGSMGGVEYEAMTPEAIASEAAKTKLSGEKAISESRVKAVTDILDRPEFAKSIPPNLRSAILAGASGIPGMPTLMQGLDYNKPRTPAPVDPMVARQRQSLLESRTAQSYVEAAQGDAVKAYADYKAQNPTASIPEREFKSAAYRLQNKMTNADAVSALVTMLLNPAGTTNP
jgi:hypothetical protein